MIIKKTTKKIFSIGCSRFARRHTAGKHFHPRVFNCILENTKYSWLNVKYKNSRNSSSNYGNISCRYAPKKMYKIISTECIDPNQGLF